MDTDVVSLVMTEPADVSRLCDKGNIQAAVHGYLPITHKKIQTPSWLIEEEEKRKISSTKSQGIGKESKANV